MIPESERPRKRWRNVPIVAVLVLGLGVAVAPAIFQMFGRAPKGGDMIEEFRPHMSQAQVDLFRGYLVEIGEADVESDALRAALVSSGAVDATTYDAEFSSIVNLNEGWPAIRDDMTDLLDRMQANLDNYAAVDALPPFALFPWFFVLPGLAIAVVAGGVLWSRRHDRAARPGQWLLVGLGVALILAPVAFQMFDRAPQGRDMIDDFRPMMTRERVQGVQGYFVTLGAAEGQLRTKALPLLEDSGESAADYPALARYSADWPTIVTDFNPMVAAMSDNVDNFQAIDALPSFSLFPWFFALPGVLVATLALVSVRQRPKRPDDSGAVPSASEAEPSESEQGATT